MTGFCLCVQREKGFPYAWRGLENEQNRDDMHGSTTQTQERHLGALKPGWCESPQACVSVFRLGLQVCCRHGWDRAEREQTLREDDCMVKYVYRSSRVFFLHEKPSKGSQETLYEALRLSWRFVACGFLSCVDCFEERHCGLRLSHSLLWMRGWPPAFQKLSTQSKRPFGVFVPGLYIP